MGMQLKKTVKISKYSMFINKDDGSCVVYNSLTGAIILVDDELFLNRLNAIQTAESTFEYCDSDELHNCFYENGIIVDSDTDEYGMVMYSYEQEVIRDTTLTLILITSRQCNLRCVYCYEKHENKHMDNTIYESVLRFIENSLEKGTYSGVNISLFGGEPFLPFNRVSRFLAKAKALCKEYGVPFIAGATTNFALVTPERFDVLSELNCSLYQVTVDGPACTHDKYRPKSTGDGSFQEIIQNLRYAKQSAHKFNIIIRTNFNKEITVHARSFYEFIHEEFNDPRFHIYFEGIKRLGGENDDTMDIWNQDETVDSTSDIGKIVSDFKLQNAATDFFTRPFQGVCYASKHNSFVIDYDGTVRKCTVRLDDEANNIGYITEKGLMQLESSRHSKWLCKNCKLSDECRDCSVLPICFGGRCSVKLLNGRMLCCDQDAEANTIKSLLKYIA